MEDKKTPLNPIESPLFIASTKCSKKVLADIYQPYVLKGYEGKDIHSIEILTTREIEFVSCYVGGLIFYRVIGKIGRFKKCVYIKDERNELEEGCLTRDGHNYLAFVLDNQDHFISDLIFIRQNQSGLRWCPFTGDKNEIFKYVSNKIHPSVKFSQLHQLNLIKAPPIEDKPDSYYAILKHKIKEKLESGVPAVLPKKDYENKEIQDIPLQILRNFKLYPCTVGKVTFYPFCNLLHFKNLVFVHYNEPKLDLLINPCTLR